VVNAEKPKGTLEYQRVLATGRKDLISEYIIQNHRGLDVKRIQGLMLLASHLSPDSELARILSYALALPSGPWLARATRVTDTSLLGIKAWLESNWVLEDMSPGEKKLVSWQNSRKEMEAAIRELKEIEEVLGVKLAAQIVQETSVD
jgi:hypothetical protein